MISKGLSTTRSIEEILSYTNEFSILKYYLGVTKVPCLINSPFRVDNKPSFSLYYNRKGYICFTDFSNNDSGGLFNLLSKMWNLSFIQTLNKVYNDLPAINNTNNYNIELKKLNNTNTKHVAVNTDLKCIVRNWEQHDVEYWKSYGISTKWLDYADVYPISHKLLYVDGIKTVYKCDKYAYAYVERKEDNITLKIYQPFNTEGFKWTSKHDRSVISLWTKIPKTGKLLIISASLKDALCVWANTKVPCIALQGEGYSISNRVINELNERYDKIIISFDGDAPGINNAKKLSEQTNWIFINSPSISENNKIAKDWSDIYHHFGKERFLNEFNNIIFNK